jgi:O-antigen/teichoic acid export membrane protein
VGRPDEVSRTLSAPEVRRRAIDGVVSVAFREIALRVLGLLGNLVLARLLTPKEFGVFAFGYTLIALAGFIADGGLGAKLIQRTEEPTMPQLRSLHGVTLLASFAALALTAAIGLPFGLPGRIATLMACSLPLSALRAPTTVLAERRMLYAPIVRADIVQTISYNVIAIGLVLVGLGVWGLAIAVVVSTVTGTIFLLTVGPVGFIRPSFSLRHVRPFLSYGFQFQAVGVVSTLRDQGLNLAAAGVGGLAVLGIWSLAQRVLQGIMLVFTSLWRVSFPAVSRLIDSGEDPRPSVQRALSLSTIVTGFAVVAVGGTGPALVAVAFGAKWHGVTAVLPWAAAGILVSGPISTTAVSLLYARNEPRTVLIAVVAHSLVWFAVAVPLIPSLGAEALGIGWFAGAAADCALLARALGRYGVRVLPYSGFPALVAVAAGALSWLIASNVRPPGAAFGASLVTGEGVYLAIMLVCQRALILDLYRLVSGTASRLGRAPVLPVAK